MAIEQMVRSASDNKYIHKDFHNGLNLGITYLQESYGDEAVREYLQQFANAFYSPLKKTLCDRGLVAIEEHYKDIYEAEEVSCDVTCERTDDELVMRVKRCPAITHMRKSNQVINPLYYETTLTVHNTICEGTPYAFELVSYNEEDGASVQRFYRRGEKK